MIQALKAGKKCARSGWNGKRMYLLLVEGREYGVCFHADLRKGWGIECPELAPWIGMKTADTKFVPWLASQTDLLADDWMII